MEELLANHTYAIDKSYKSQLEGLGLDFSMLKDLNATEELLQWNVTDFKQLLSFFVEYHNKVAEQG